MTGLNLLKLRITNLHRLRKGEFIEFIKFFKFFKFIKFFKFVEF